MAASLYNYATDAQRAPTIALPLADTGGAGRITDLKGTGWNTLAFKGTWRPSGLQGAHVVDMGYQRESYKLRSLVSTTSIWITGDAGSRVSAFQGSTELNSLFIQDTWRLSSDWKTTLGARLEQWRAFDGAVTNTSSTLNFAKRRETSISPKAAIAFQAAPDWALRASVGRAVRLPTVAELYQGSISSNVIINNDPNLKAEKSWTSEFSAERTFSNGIVRATLFQETTVDALYSQTNVTVAPNVTNIQNVDRIRTAGVELAAQANDVGVRGLNLTSSLTYANSVIAKNDNFPDSVGKLQPRVPKWRANFVATYRPNDDTTLTFGARYSGKQFGTLDSSDPNGATYTGFSNSFVTDIRVRYQLTKQWGGSLGIDNLNNANYWAFHPYTQRTVMAEVKFDL